VPVLDDGNLQKLKELYYFVVTSKFQSDPRIGKLCGGPLLEQV
jgi:hypothetical protein